MGQSDNVMSYPPVPSNSVDYVAATACHGDSPLTRTPHFCLSHCESWHIHHRKEPLERITALVVAPIQCRPPTVHSRKSSGTTSLSSLSSCDLTSLTVAHQALIIVSASTSCTTEWARSHGIPSQHAPTTNLTLWRRNYFFNFSTPCI
jgi:hypothetical protein